MMNMEAGINTHWLLFPGVVFYQATIVGSR